MASFVSRLRTSKPKVRSGCAQCKIRHVKCDETKPSCLRCTKGGRVCEYGASIIPNPVVSFGTLEERRVLRFYREVAAPEMSRYFDGPFWTAYILRITEDVPAAKHILIALASSYERRQQYPKNACPPNSGFALTQVSKSLTQLHAEKSPSLVSVLLCCILMTVYGNMVDESSLIHLASGFNIIDEIDTNADHPLTKSLTASELRVVRRLLAPILGRLSYSYVLCDSISTFRETLKRGSGLWKHRTTDVPSIPTTFQNLFQAEGVTLDYVRFALRQLQASASSLSGYQSSSEGLYLQETVSKQFVHAIDTFIDQVDKPLQFLSLEDRSPLLLGSALMLKINHIYFLICLKSINFVEETQFDILEDDFRLMLSCCQKHIIASKIQQDIYGHRTFGRRIFYGTDYSLQLPLLVISGKCRHPQIRRQASDLLVTAGIEEGFAESPSVAVIAKLTIHLEEQGLNQVLAASDVPESNRIRGYYGTYFPTGQPGPGGNRFRFCYETAPFRRTSTDASLTNAYWFPVTTAKRMFAFIDVNQYAISYIKDPQGAVSTPDTLEAIIAEDRAQGRMPGIVLSPSRLAWLHDTTAMSYRYMSLSHPLLDNQALQF